MFSRKDAIRLRENAGAINFAAAGSANAEVASSEQRSLIDSYRSHYKLNFENVSANVEHRIGTFDSGPYKIVCQYFIPEHGADRGTAFLLHGYFDHAGIYRHLIEHCLQLGLAVVVFDFPGHGLSSGEIANIASYREYNTVLADCLMIATEQGVTQPWSLIGQSTGGAIIMDSLLDNKLAEKFSFAHYILLGPLVRPKRWKRSRILFTFSRWFKANSPRRFSQNSHDKDFLQFLARRDDLQSKILSRDWIVAMIEYQKRFEAAGICNEKLHTIQGTGDGTVDWEYNLPRIKAKFPSAESFIIEGARHHLINESEQYRIKVMSEISRILELDT